MNNKRKKIAITGNIGAGKSALLKILKDYPRTHVIMADLLGKKVMADPANREKITEILGDVFTNDMPDRDKIHAAMFSDEGIKAGNKKNLDAFVFPLVRAMIDEEIEATDKDFIFVESALIFEAGWADYFDMILVVTANSDVQRKRLMSNRGMTAEKIDQVLATQNISPERFKLADYVIDNSGDLYDLKVSVSRFVREFLFPTIGMEPGSYDPITFGHTDIIDKARKQFDLVVVVVGINPKKNCMFTTAEQVAMVKAATQDMGNVLVESYRGIIVEYADKYGAQALIRGIRGDSDMVMEEDLKKANAFICPHIQTVYIHSSEGKDHISSSLLRETFAMSDNWENLARDLVPEGVMHELRVKKYTPWLEKRFNEFVERCSPANVYWKKDVFNELVQKYSEPHRAYHNVVHLYELFQDFDLIKDLCKDPNLVEDGIFWHDLFYDVILDLYSSNEERSAIEAQKKAHELKLPDRFYTGIYSMVMVTDHGKHQPQSFDEQLLADIDLAILGKSEERFVRYEKEIRSEFNFVPAKTFYSVRGGILAGFLKKDNIYHTEFFRNKYEAQARINLENILKTDLYCIK